MRVPAEPPPDEGTYPGWVDCHTRRLPAARCARAVVWSCIYLQSAHRCSCQVLGRDVRFALPPSTVAQASRGHTSAHARLHADRDGGRGLVDARDQRHRAVHRRRPSVHAHGARAAAAHRPAAGDRERAPRRVRAHRHNEPTPRDTPQPAATHTAGSNPVRATLGRGRGRDPRHGERARCAIIRARQARARARRPHTHLGIGAPGPATNAAAGLSRHAAASAAEALDIGMTRTKKKQVRGS